MLGRSNKRSPEPGDSTARGERGGMTERPATALDHQVMQMQRAYGNRAVMQFLKARSSVAGHRRIPIQRKPVADRIEDTRHFHDDQKPDLKLVREDPSFFPAGHEDIVEYRLKDMLQPIYWHKVKENYYTAVTCADEELFAVDEYLGNKQFGAWLETYKEVEHATHKLPPKNKEKDALSMHLLQQFFTNALLNTEEVARFDYQASPLNYQGENTYIRAAATNIVRVLQDQLNKVHDEEKTFLAQDMSFRRVMHQVFSEIIIEKDPDEETLKKNMQPLADKIRQFLEQRKAEKDLYDQELVEAARVKELHEQLPKVEIGTLSVKEQGVQDLHRLRNLASDLKIDTYDGIAPVLEKARLDLQNVKIKIEELQKQLEKEPTSEEQSTESGVKSGVSVTKSTGSEEKSAPSSTKKKAVSPEFLIGIERRKEAAFEEKVNQLEALLAAANRVIAQDEGARQHLKAGAWKVPLKQLFDEQVLALDEDTAFSNGARELMNLENKERKRIDSPFVWMHGLDAQIKDLTFVDFTDVLSQESDVKTVFGEGGLAEKAKVALRERVKEDTIRWYLQDKCPEENYPGLDREELFRVFSAYLAAVAQKGKKEPTQLPEFETLHNLLAAHHVEKEQDPEELKQTAQGLSELLGEIQASKRISALIVSGGMIRLNKDTYDQPALLVSDKVLTAQINSALGKSGSVPTPTYAARKLLGQGVPLKKIVSEIIQKQAERGTASETTKQKLNKIKGDIASFTPDDPEKGYRSVVGAVHHMKTLDEQFEEFASLAKVEQDYVRLLATPVVKMIDTLGLLNEDSEFPALAKEQLHTHLADAVHNQTQIVQFVRSIQNIHEMIILALEKDEAAVSDDFKADFPAGPEGGAKSPHMTHYGLAAYSQAYNAAVKQHQADGRDGMNIEAFYNIYFEMMEQLVYTQRASGENVTLHAPQHVQSFLQSESFQTMRVKHAQSNFIAIDIHPNDAARKEMARQDIEDLMKRLFEGADPDFKCTVFVDVTLNHIDEEEVHKLVQETAAPYIESGQLNLVFSQSLTKFAQYGMDKHSGGLVFHYNKGEKWAAFNQYMQEAAQKDRVDPTIQKYFQLLFQETKDEQKQYLKKVRTNTEYVYKELQKTFAKLKIDKNVIGLFENRDDQTCYVTFHYQEFAAELFALSRDADAEIKKFAHDILENGLNALIAKLNLPLNMRQSFGFPLSNFGDIEPGIRLTVGIEEKRTLDQYVQVISYIEGKLDSVIKVEGTDRLKDQKERQKLLLECVEQIKSAEDLEREVQTLLA
ncbi:hypothetical protein OS242_09755 [Tumebacillus sp. DT12]|uniref:Uncharacterized protein n=1 Tax=Tumebacillus lacus TaxID=2995335 RepID=A0ABT3X3P2_9BACL|nr:hypothetical protein [Tumebacillus lacus]MCX7570246.1 hypothetical protein [Tumebacillus lacus]